MEILGFKIRFEFSIRKNVGVRWFGSAMLGCLCLGLAQTNYLASYRLGEAVVPGETQLIRTGPYEMSKIEVRNGTVIRFQTIGVGNTYVERWTHFDITPDQILDLVQEMNGRPVAYLWIFSTNQQRQIWKVAVNNRVILSYNRACQIYKLENSYGYSMFYAAIIFFFFSIITMFSVSRIRKDHAMIKTDGGMNDSKCPDN